MFWGQIFETDILMDLHVLKSPECGNHIFCIWSVSLCGSVCIGVFYQHNSKANGSSNTKFSIVHLYDILMPFESFYKDRRKSLFIGANNRILIHYGLWSEFLVSKFSYISIAVNKMKFTFIFVMVKNM